MKTIAIAILLGAAITMPVFADNAGSTALEANVTDDAGSILQADSIVADKNRELAELTVKLAALQDAFDAAFPYAEFCIMTGDLPIGEGGFETADTVELKKATALLEKLSPYSEAIKSRHDTLVNAAAIVKRFNELTKFDDMPYSEQLVNDTANGLLELCDNGKDIINAAKGEQIDSLYVKADTYRSAVESFATLIGEIDNQTGQFRDNEAADNLCREEIGNVKSNSADAIAKINSYRYLSELYRRYIAELDKSPRSTTEEIRRKIAAMLASDNDTGNCTDNQ